MSLFVVGRFHVLLLLFDVFFFVFLFVCLGGLICRTISFSAQKTAPPLL